MAEIKHTDFLARFVGRGWLHAARDDADEKEAVAHGLREGWLRMEMSEAHFTPAGRAALSKATDNPVHEGEG